MADALKPWIGKYLLDIAEQYGAQLYKAPAEQKSKKVQLVQFLTYCSESQPSFVWAIASDKSHKLPIRLSAEAIKKYQGTHGKRLSKEKTAVISIKCYKPLFCRVPNGGQGMTQDAFLALECDYFTVLGSLGEACFGEPKSIEDVEELKLWGDGLRQEGGAGNVLKNRKTMEESKPYMDSYNKKWKRWKKKELEHPEDKDVAMLERLGWEETDSEEEKEYEWVSWEKVQMMLGLARGVGRRGD